jgi:hypothetical protein
MACTSLPVFADTDPPTFTDTRVTPVGNDKLDVGNLVTSDTWSVDIALNSTDTVVGGKLTAEHSFSGIWSGSGPSNASKTINTITSYISQYYTGRTVYYQYQFHDTRSSVNKQWDIDPGPYFYEAP